MFLEDALVKSVVSLMVTSRTFFVNGMERESALNVLLKKDARLSELELTMEHVSERSVANVCFVA